MLILDRCESDIVATIQVSHNDVLAISDVVVHKGLGPSDFDSHPASNQRIHTKNKNKFSSNMKWVHQLRSCQARERAILVTSARLSRLECYTASTASTCKYPYRVTTSK